MLGVKPSALQSTLVSADTRKRSLSAAATASDRLTGSLVAGLLNVPVTASCPVTGAVTVWPKYAEMRKSLPAEYVNSGLRLASESGASLYVITGAHSTWSKA